ncbi:thrombin inhibitor rhodniin [Cherax quadricarinatus]|uniref:thrombin inhibitor rhodniin n=1 Tax=Cherax quadricarinatus TaxID=27406 RepID=UPI00387EA94B
MAPRCCMIVVVMAVIMAVTAVPHGPGQHGPGFGRKPAPAGSDCPLACPASYFPVCGSDGKTYGNECGLQAASCRDPTITKIGSGECESDSSECTFYCSSKIVPVCGSDGKSYSNSCRLRLASCKDPSISQAHDGVCVNV